MRFGENQEKKVVLESYKQHYAHLQPPTSSLLLLSHLRIWLLESKRNFFFRWRRAYLRLILEQLLTSIAKFIKFIFTMSSCCFGVFHQVFGWVKQEPEQHLHKRYMSFSTRYGFLLVTLPLLCIFDRVLASNGKNKKRNNFLEIPKEREKKKKRHSSSNRG